MNSLITFTSYCFRKSLWHLLFVSLLPIFITTAIITSTLLTLPIVSQCIMIVGLITSDRWHIIFTLPGPSLTFNGMSRLLPESAQRFSTSPRHPWSTRCCLFVNHWILTISTIGKGLVFALHAAEGITRNMMRNKRHKTATRKNGFITSKMRSQSIYSNKKCRFKSLKEILVEKRLPSSQYVLASGWKKRLIPN